MKFKGLILGTAAYIVIVFVLAVVWHIVIFKDLYVSLGYFGRAEPSFVLGMLSMVFQGVTLSYALPLFYRDGLTLKNDLRFGLTMGVFFWSCHVVAASAKVDINLVTTFFAIETPYLAIQFTLAVMALRYIYKRTELET